MFGPYTFTPTAGIPATQPWNISFGTQLVGGTATLTYTYMGTMNNAYPFSLCINGTNPNQSTVLGYLGTNPWFLPKIASVESGFQQFCLMPSGCLNGASSGQPFWTQEPSNPQPSHDFGLMQINRIQGSERESDETATFTQLSSPAEPRGTRRWSPPSRSEEHTSELQSLRHLVCRLLLEKK